MYFEYLYEPEAELFTFIRVPKLILEDERFSKLNAESKLLFGILLDRVALSRKNGWIDSQGRVYVIMTIDEIAESLACATQKATKLLHDLERFGLIKKVRQGLGKPNLIYVKNFIPRTADSQFKNDENHNSGGVISTIQECRKSQCNNTNINNTDVSNTDSFFPSEESLTETTGGIDVRERIRKQIEYKCMVERYGKRRIDEIVEIMSEIAVNQNPIIKVGKNAEFPAQYVRERFDQITSMHIERVVEGIEDNQVPVRNTKAYLLAVLFNSVSTIDHYYTIQANADFATSSCTAQPIKRYERDYDFEPGESL